MFVWGGFTFEEDVRQKNKPERWCLPCKWNRVPVVGDQITASWCLFAAFGQWFGYNVIPQNEISINPFSESPPVLHFFNFAISSIFSRLSCLLRTPFHHVLLPLSIPLSLSLCVPLPSKGPNCDRNSNNATRLCTTTQPPQLWRSVITYFFVLINESTRCCFSFCRWSRMPLVFKWD